MHLLENMLLSVKHKHETKRSKIEMENSKVNKKANIAVEVLVFLIVVSLVSGTLLFLIQSNVIQVQGAAVQQQPILNANFIPSAREGSIAIIEFQFCDVVTQDYLCTQEKNTFANGDEVHFRFVVETSSYENSVVLFENYRLLDPTGEVILDVEDKKDLFFETRTTSSTEKVTFKDYFFAGYELESGTYTLELIIHNSILNKKATVIKTFELVN